jgi:hypothetical protein
MLGTAITLGAVIGLAAVIALSCPDCSKRAVSIVNHYTQISD